MFDNDIVLWARIALIIWFLFLVLCIILYAFINKFILNNYKNRSILRFTTIGQWGRWRLSHINHYSSKKSFFNQIIYCLTNCTVPKRYFTHFYIIGFIISCYGLIFLMNEYRDHRTFFEKIIILCYFSSMFMIFIQTLRRLIESLNLVKYGNNDMHISHYIIGTLFYLCIVVSIIIECMYSLKVLKNKSSSSRLGLLKVEKLLLNESAQIELSKYFKLMLFFVIIFFPCVSFLQYQSHYILAKLKKYSIPYGSTFKYSSNPHYLCEIIIYTIICIPMFYTFLYLIIGYQIFIPEFIPTSWIFILLFVISNLSWGASQSHQWYLSKFKDYPKNRSILIPKIF